MVTLQLVGKHLYDNYELFMYVNPHRRSEGQHHHHPGERVADQRGSGTGSGGRLPLHRLHPPHSEKGVFQERHVSILYIVTLVCYIQYFNLLLLIKQKEKTDLSER